MGKKYSLLLKEYEKRLKERVARGELKEKAAKVYSEAPSRILEAIVKEMPPDKIAGIVKKTDTNITRGYLDIIKRAARHLREIAFFRVRK